MSTLELARDALRAVRDDIGPEALATLLAFRVPASNPTTPDKPSGLLVRPDGQVDFMGVLHAVLAGIRDPIRDSVGEYLTTVMDGSQLIGFEISQTAPAVAESQPLSAYRCLYDELQSLIRNERGESQDAERIRVRMDGFWSRMSDQERRLAAGRSVEEAD